MNISTMTAGDNRMNWKLADVHHTTLLLPGPYAEYLKGLLAFLNGVVLINKIKEGDEHVLENFSDKQPRLPFSTGDVILEAKNVERQADNAADEASQKVLKERYDDLMTIVDRMNERTALQMEGKMAASEGRAGDAQIAFANDYATSYLIRGAYKMYQEKRDGRALPREFFEWGG